MLVTEHTSDDPQFPCGDYSTEVSFLHNGCDQRSKSNSRETKSPQRRQATTNATWEKHPPRCKAALVVFHTGSTLQVIQPTKTRMNSSFQDHLRHVVVFFTPHRELHKNWQIYWRDSGTGEKLLNVRNLVGLSSMSRDLPTSTQILNGASAWSSRMPWWWQGPSTRWTNGPWWRELGGWWAWGGTSTGSSPHFCLLACPAFPWHWWD